MYGETEKETLSLTPLGSGMFEINREFVYVFPWTIHGGVTEFVVIPEGVKTNFATTYLPKCLISPDNKHIMVGSVVHDYLVKEFKGDYVPTIYHGCTETAEVLHEECEISWERANEVLKSIMKEDGSPWWKYHLVYNAVKVYGMISGYNKDCKEGR